MAEPTGPLEQARRIYEGAESRTAAAIEELVNTDAFGGLLARVVENVVVVTKISNDMLDMVLRNLRLAGRQDVARLARQLSRTEDKLESLLQQVEDLGDRMDRRSGSGPGAGAVAAKASRPVTSRRRPAKGNP